MRGRPSTSLRTVCVRKARTARKADQAGGEVAASAIKVRGRRFLAI